MESGRTFVHNDHLGSASIVTNSGGALVEETKYDPWGEVKSGGTASKFLYTGQEKDLETNLNYYNFRYYDSHIRRFTQPDDLIQDAYSPQSLNRYSYVQNNPIRYTDPTGHYIESGVDIAFIGYDLYTIAKDPSDSTNYAALGGDLGGLLLPGATGIGLGVRTANHAGDIAKVANNTKNTEKIFSNVIKYGEEKVTKMEYSKHTLERMEQKSITTKQVEKTIENNKSFSYNHDSQVKTGYFDKSSKVFVATTKNKILTVFNTTQKYINNLLKKK